MKKESAPQETRIHTILDVIGDGLRIQEDILIEVRERLNKEGNTEDIAFLDHVKSAFKTVDEIEIVEVPVINEFPWIDHKKGKEITHALGLKAEDRVISILLQFDDLIYYVESTSQELDRKGIDLMIHFHPQLDYPDIGIQVKSSQHGIDKFKSRRDYQMLVAQYNLILVNAHPARLDSSIYLYLRKKIEKRLNQNNALTKIS